MDRIVSFWVTLFGDMAALRAVSAGVGGFLQKWVDGCWIVVFRGNKWMDDGMMRP
jgi:hypothetical protein